MEESWFFSIQKQLISGILRHLDRIPQHVGIVMDGNRRYARIHGQARKEGHATGFATMGELLSVAYSAGISTVSVYAFSIENFNRSADEVEDLMNIARERLKELVEYNGLCKTYGVRINVLGHLDLLPPDIIELVHFVTSSTKDNAQATLNLCMPYTARDDMATAIRKLAPQTDPICTETITNSLYTGESPPLDLLIRTSGTYRLSDFLLWEITKNTVIDFVPELWPEYSPWCLFKSVLKWRLEVPN